MWKILIDYTVFKTALEKKHEKENSPERLLLNRIWTIWFVHFLKRLSVHSPFVVHASLPTRMQMAKKKDGKSKSKYHDNDDGDEEQQKISFKRITCFFLSSAFAKWYTMADTRIFSKRFSFEQIQLNYRRSILSTKSDIKHISNEEKKLQDLMLLKWVGHIAYILIDYPLK